MVDRADDRVASSGIGLLDHVQDRRRSVLADLVPEAVAILAHRPESEHPRQQLVGPPPVALQQRRPSEALYGVLGGHGAVRPAFSAVRFGRSQYLEQEPIWVIEGEALLAEAPDAIRNGDAVLPQALLPEGHRLPCYREGGRHDLARPAPAPRGVRPGEEGHGSAGCAHLIPVVEVVGARVVEVHGLVDEPQAQAPLVEVHVALRIAAYGRHVVDAGRFFVHLLYSLSRVSALLRFATTRPDTFEYILC